MSRIWDISQPLHAAVPVWPGEPAFALHSHAVIGDGCPVNVGGMFTPLHAGTHGDAPLHYANDGVSSADCDLDPYIGPCVLLDVRHARGRVEIADIDWTAIDGAERFELFWQGIELADGFHELVDPAEQQRRFESDQAWRAANGRPVPPFDSHLIAALQAGLPACAGVALGLDRLLMLERGLSEVAAAMSLDGERA